MLSEMPLQNDRQRDLEPEPNRQCPLWAKQDMLEKSEQEGRLKAREPEWDKGEEG